MGKYFLKYFKEYQYGKGKVLTQDTTKQILSQIFDQRLAEEIIDLAKQEKYKKKL